MITTEKFTKPCGCRSVEECNHNIFAEGDALDALVDAFALEMKAKLQKKRYEGRQGWDAPANYAGIRASLIEHVLKAGCQWVDVANLAAMLWNLENGDAERIAAIVEGGERAH